MGTNGPPSVFNTGQIVLGLLSAFQETDNERYRNAVADACDWLVDQQTQAGYWDEHDYQGAAHAYSTRVAWALLKAAAVLSDRAGAYRDAACRNLHWAVDLQRPNGWFEKAAFEPGGTPFLHTIAYTVRGLLEGGWLLDDDSLVDAARHTADELLALQRTEGILKGAYDVEWSPSWYYCLTGNAQMAVVWLRLFAHTGSRRYQLAARAALEFLKKYQVPEGTPRIRGALGGSFPLFGRYMYLRYPNWAVKFLVDALLLADDRESTRQSSLNSRACTSSESGWDGHPSTPTTRGRASQVPEFF